MRTFTLLDKDGASYNLTDQYTAFLYNVEGLGYSRKIEYQQIGDRYEATKDTLAQGIINGIIRFRQPDAYNEYFRFTQFCQNAPLRLIYTPGTTPFYRDGTITSITKTEGADGVLSCSVQFSASSPWYRTVYEYNPGEISGGKVYSYEYSYVYSNNVAGTISIQNDSYLDSPTKITIYGPAENPTWRHYINNVLASTGKVTTTIESGNKLVIDTTTTPYSIKQFNLANELVSDVYQLSDFSTQRFVVFKNGRNTVSVSHDGSSILKLGVEARVEYASV